MAVLINTPTTRRLTDVRADAPRKATENSKWEVLSRGEPYVHVVEVAAGSLVPSHSHSQPEVMVILSGSLKVDDTQCDAGSVAIIPPNEKYSLLVGDEPVTFVVIRPAPAVYSQAE